MKLYHKLLSEAILDTHANAHIEWTGAACVYIQR